MANFDRHIYKISLNGQDKGFLNGSLHSHMNPLEFNELQLKMGELCKSVHKVYLECPLPHHQALQFGMEKAVLMSLENAASDLPLYYFESLQFQHAMLNSTLWMGTKIVRTPWLNYAVLSKRPHFWLYVAKAFAFAASLFNRVYNIFTLGKHSLAFQKYNTEQYQILLEMIKNYTEGLPVLLSENEEKMFLMQPRNQHMLNEIRESLKQSEAALYVVGVAHLFGNNGLLTFLRQDGYCFEQLPQRALLAGN